MYFARIIVGAGLVFAAASAYAQNQTFLLVSSSGTNSVRMYDAQTGEFIRNWAPPGIGGLQDTQEVIYGPDGFVYVSGFGTPEILKFDGVTGKYLGPFTSGYELDSPTKISWGPDGLMYVSQWGQSSSKRNVVRFNPATGEFIDEFTTDNPLGASDQDWDADGNMYLASYFEKRVIKYAPDGSRIGYFTPSDPVQSPIDIYWARNGDLMVVDWSSGRVNAFDGDTGAFKRTFIQGLINAEGITQGPDGRLYAADWSENTIKTYSLLTGQGGAKFIGEDGGLVHPNSLIFGPQEVATSISDVAPESFSLEAETNFPNPFASHTAIPFTMDVGGPVLLQVFDLQGRLVSTTRKASARAGGDRFDVDGSGLSSGRYVYRLQVSGLSYTGVMVRR